MNTMFNQRFNRISINNADDNLYATNVAGSLLRYDLNNTGTLTELGDNNLYVVNKKDNKKYKITLEEVT